jgi:hypothetical protein
VVGFSQAKKRQFCCHERFAGNLCLSYCIYLLVYYLGVSTVLGPYSGILHGAIMVFLVYNSNLSYPNLVLSPFSLDRIG